jgi:hypothetical protein
MALWIITKDDSPRARLFTQDEWVRGYSRSNTQSRLVGRIDASALGGAYLRATL